jgi:hypothetical protein
MRFTEFFQMQFQALKEKGSSGLLEEAAFVMD